MNKPHIQVIVAYSTNRVIGNNNKMPWHLPSDLAHFKRATMGHPIIMGRKTWESLGRALPGRPNLVISRDANYQAKGAEVFTSIEAALNKYSNVPTVCIIGGAQLYELAMPLVDEIIATEIHAEILGDTWFPALEPNHWHETERLPQPEENGLKFDYVRYARN